MPDIFDQLAEWIIDNGGEAWPHGDHVYAADGRIVVRIPLAGASPFGWERRRPGEFPPAHLWFVEWGKEPCGMPLEVPMGPFLDRQRVSLGPIDIMGRYAALLRMHGIYRVTPRSRPFAPLRFECGPVEGLLMPVARKEKSCAS